MKEKDPEKVKGVILDLLKTTRKFILDRNPDAQAKELSNADCNELANWYQEISLTWRRIRYFADNNMAEEAYCDAGYLQQELFYIAQEFGVEEMNLLDSYDADDLGSLKACADELERKVLSVLGDHKVTVNSYESVDAFLEARS
jgi:hypothetical protein